MREKIKLESTAGTGHFYTTNKNKRTTPDKLEIRKFDPVARKHVSTKKPRSSDRGKAVILTQVRIQTQNKKARASGLF